MMGKSIAKKTVKGDATTHQNHQPDRQVSSPFQRHNDKKCAERKKQRDTFDLRAKSTSEAEFIKSIPLHQRAIHTLQFQIDLIQKNPENWRQILKQGQGACVELLALADGSGYAIQGMQSSQEIVEPMMENTLMQPLNISYEDIHLETPNKSSVKALPSQTSQQSMSDEEHLNHTFPRVTAIRSVGSKDKLKLVGKLLELKAQGKLPAFQPKKGGAATPPSVWISLVLSKFFDEKTIALLQTESEYWYQVDEKVYNIMRVRRQRQKF